MPVEGTELVAKNIIKVGGGFLRQVNETMKEVRFILDKKVTDNISITDHTTSDLRLLGHPYASKWGTSRASSLHTPFWLVHTQSGKLLDSKNSGTTPASLTGGKLKAFAYVGLDKNIAPHALFVIFGTSKMIPRPVLEGSREQVIDDAKGIIQKGLKNLVANFKGEKK